MDAILESFRGKSRFLVFSVILFFVGVVVGYIIFWHDPSLIFKNIERFLGNILKIGKAIEDHSKLYVIGLIFQNNIKALILIIFGGVVFGLVPLFSILFNGFAVGLVLAISIYQGQSITFFLAAMLPHGILELPAVLMGGAFGLKTGFDLIFPKKLPRLGLLKENLSKSVLALGILVPVLFIAAGIEAVITPYVAKYFI
jgi:stage II sporulation protein M